MDPQDSENGTSSPTADPNLDLSKNLPPLPSLANSVATNPSQHILEPIKTVEFEVESFDKIMSKYDSSSSAAAPSKSSSHWASATNEDKDLTRFDNYDDPSKSNIFSNDSKYITNNADNNISLELKDKVIAPIRVSSTNVKSAGAKNDKKSHFAGNKKSLAFALDNAESTVDNGAYNNQQNINTNADRPFSTHARNDDDDVDADENELLDPDNVFNSYNDILLYIRDPSQGS